jgi:hypothetical protein
VEALELPHNTESLPLFSRGAARASVFWGGVLGAAPERLRCVVAQEPC